MDQRSEVFDLERRFWIGDADFYQRKLARAVVMVFPPPVGVLDRAAVLRTLLSGARWSTVEMAARQSVELAPGVLAVNYRAAARREGAPTYRAQVGSVYLQEESEWKLAFHQQTPLPRETEEES